MTLEAHARYYTELSGLGELRRQARQSPQEARAEVARQFEAMFVQMMLTQMRGASPATEDGLLGQGGGMYRDLLDKQLSMEMSAAGGLGLARQIEGSLAVGDRRPDAAAGEHGEETAATDAPHRLRMPLVPDVEARARAAEAALERVQRSLERLATDPFNGEVLPGTDAAGESASGPSLRPEAAPAGTPVDRSRARFDSPEDFVRSLRGAASAAAQQLGATPDVLLAQAALETGWGKHLLRGAHGENSHNLFGIKADSRWNGPRVEVTTTEYRHGHAVREKASFRAYASYEESFRDYVDFLRQNRRYDRALAQSERPHQFIQALQQAGYATDPLYARKVVAVMQAAAFDAGRLPVVQTR